MTFTTVTDGVDYPQATHINQFANLDEGWIPATGTWAYASASTITIPTDGTTDYRKYMKVRFKQGAGYKYYICSAIAATTLTVFVNTDYTVANSTITDVYYSFHDAPYGFPLKFAYTPTLVGISGYTAAFYTVTGSTATIFFSAESHSVTGTTTVTISHPFTLSANVYRPYAMNTPSWSFPFMIISNNSIQIFKDAALSNWLGSETSVHARISETFILG